MPSPKLSFLKNVPLFAGLSDEDLERLCGDAEEVHLSPGEELFAEGSVGDRAYVIREGSLEVHKASNGRKILLARREAGEIIGEMALMEDTPRSASVHSCGESTLLAIHKDDFYGLLKSSPSAAEAMFFTILDRFKGTEAMLRQSEKMAQLGTMTAGVAHELNNPAAAVARGADQLRGMLSDLDSSRTHLNALDLTEEQRTELQTLSKRAQELATQPPEMDAMVRSDREYEIQSWLEDQKVDEAWVCAPTLVNLNFDSAELDQMATRFTSDQLPGVITWLNNTHSAHNLLAEIGQGSSRISQIVKALKSYSFLDQAPVQEIDVHEGLDDTLLILRHKLKPGITVRREYAPSLPKIGAHGSELNQVWTNLIDNAADALGGEGVIVLRSRQEDGFVVVEIEDNGPGIPAEIQSRVFDSFFTTKPPGKGTGLGLGLDISYKIVVDQHRGELKLTSEPGRTVFRVSLPIRSEDG